MSKVEKISLAVCARSEDVFFLYLKVNKMPLRLIKEKKKNPFPQKFVLFFFSFMRGILVFFGFTQILPGGELSDGFREKK